MRNKTHLSELKAKDFLARYISWSWDSSLQEEFSTARLTFEEYDPEAFEKIRTAASLMLTPCEQTSQNINLCFV